MNPIMQPGWMLVSRLKPLRRPVKEGEIELPRLHVATLNPYIVEQSESKLYQKGQIIAVREEPGRVPHTLELNGVLFGMLHETQSCCAIEVGDDVPVERHDYSVERLIRADQQAAEAAKTEELGQKLVGV